MGTSSRKTIAAIRRNSRRVTAGAIAAIVAAGLLTGSVTLPEQMPEDPDQVAFVDGVAVDPAVVERDINQELAGRETSNLPAPVWPRAGSAELAVTVDARVAAPGSGISIAQARTSATAVSSVRVDVLGREGSDALGYRDGLVFDVTRTDGGGNGTVSTRVDYAAFAHAYGADWRTRLALWTVADCDGCRPVRLETVNDIAAGIATADVPVSSRGPTRVLLAAAEEGGAGDFTATKLSPSYTWSQGGNSGSFNWSYPMKTPSPVGAGPVPAIGFSYSSASVDGRSEATNNQPGWIGEGFSYAPGSIERRYVPCADDMDGGNNVEETGDRCWRTDNAMLTMAGRGGELVRDDDNDEWHLKNDDGTVIERFTGEDNGNGDNDNEYWRLTTPDGTQYFFGRNRLPGWSSGDPVTDSTWTMPIAGNDSGEPCHDTTFASSFCDQAWKWNLDYVVDVHGNTMSYWYDKQTNKYGKTSDAASPVTYDRGGELVRIDYGTDNRDGTEYGGTVPGRVEFTLADRCLSDCGTHDEAHWPDTPWDLSCTSSTSCPDSLAPTFWSTKRLVKVTTEVWDAGLGKHVPIDSWALTHSFPNPGDGTRAGLWLESITRTGHVGGTEAMPPIEFDWVQMYNRVDVGDGEPTMNWMRMAAIWTETGGLISMTYTPVDCVNGSNMPASPGDNNKRCYPVLSEDPYDEGVINTDWFHKYLVTSISQYDQLEGLNTVRTTYEYVGAPAWRYSEPDALVQDEYRTWADFRGYAAVRVRTGEDGNESLTETTYFRGMDGDKLPGGGTRSVSVPAGVGDPITDDKLYSGMPRQTTVYNGVTTAPVSRTVYEPWKSPATATRVLNGDTTTARYTRSDATVYSQRYLTGTGTWQTAKVTKEYDDTYGTVDYVSDHGDVAVTGDEKCTFTEYNRNIAENLVHLVSRTRSYAAACPVAEGATAENFLSDTRVSYDGLAYGATPVKGLPTETEETLTLDETVTPAVPVYQSTSRMVYDEAGRVIESWDVRGNKSTTDYTPATGGPVTRTVATNHLGWTNSTDKNLRGAPLVTIDANGKRTELAYDPLGRVTKVWIPTRLRSRHEDYPFKEFEYHLSKDGKNYVVTKSLDAATGTVGGHYQVVYELYDGLLRPRQTQAPSPGAGGGRIITDTLYDYHGRAYATQGPFRATGSPSGDLYQTSAGEVFTHTETLFDRANRPTAQIVYSQYDELWRTTTSYTGDSTTVIPPSGGIPVTTITDIDGKTVEVRQHLTPDASGDALSLYYDYNNKDQLTSFSNEAGTTWTYDYDLKGRPTGVDDPDSGLTTTEYNDYGDVAALVDARGKRIEFEYDSQGRKTAMYEHSDLTAPRTKLAEWRFDTLITGASWKGQPAGWSRFDDGNEYRFDVRQMNADYRVVNSMYTIPEAEGPLAGTYVYLQSYRAGGAPETFGYPAAGNLGGETVTTTYDTTTALPDKLTGGFGSLGYVTGTDYTAFGELQHVRYSNNSFYAEQTNYYDDATRRLTRSTVTKETAPSLVTDTGYTYNPAGNITRVSEAVRGDTQCFTFDSLQRLTEAWTPGNGDCGPDPTTAAVGGPAPYWHTYAFDEAGNRTSFTDHLTTGGATTTTYAQNDVEHPHAVTDTTTTLPSGATLTGAYAYDDAGNMQARTPAGEDTQSLTWSPEGRLDTLTDTTGDTTHIYAPDGKRLIRRDPNGTTLYLPGQEVRYDIAGNSTSCSRYYTHAGSVFAVRTTAHGLQWLFNDPHGTASVAINQGNPQQVIARYQDPYGNPRGTAVAWPGERGFLNGVTDPSGLTHIGAREYDPRLGRFITQDPVTTNTDSQQIHGYAYANNSPIMYSDPTGLELSPCPDGCTTVDLPDSGPGKCDANERYIKSIDQCWPNGSGPSGIGGLGGDGTGTGSGSGPGGGTPGTNYGPGWPDNPGGDGSDGEDDGCWGDFLGSWTCDAADSVGTWLRDHAELVGAVTMLVVGVACTSILTGATFGVGIVAAAVTCGALSGALGSGITSSLQGNSGSQIAADALFGGITGGLLGLAGGAATIGARLLAPAMRGIVIGAGSSIRGAGSSLAAAGNAVRSFFRNGNNILRVGRSTLDPRANAPWRISMGAVGRSYRNLGPLGKALNPIHIHIQFKPGKIGIDLNWLPWSKYWP